MIFGGSTVLPTKLCDWEKEGNDKGYDRKSFLLLKSRGWCGLKAFFCVCFVYIKE